MILSVIDTNILVSALLKSDSIPGYILEQSLTGSVVPVLSEAIMMEYKDVLYRRKFNFPAAPVERVIKGLLNRGVFIEPPAVEDILIDPDDLAFYAAAVHMRQSNEVYLVTGNTRHFPIRPFVVTPRKMLTILTTNDF